MLNDSYRTRFPGNPHLENEGESSGLSRFLLLLQARPWDLSWQVQSLNLMILSTFIQEDCRSVLQIQLQEECRLRESLGFQANLSWVQGSRKQKTGYLPSYLLSSLGSRHWDGIRSKEDLCGSNITKENRKRQAASGKEIVRPQCKPGKSLCQPNRETRNKDGPFRQRCFGQERLGSCTTNLFSHWLCDWLVLDSWLTQILKKWRGRSSQLPRSWKLVVLS